MRLLFDIGHPAHIHLFRHFAQEMRNEGGDILFTTRDKDLTLYLLEAYQLPYISFGKTRNGIISKVMGMFHFDRKLLGVAKRYKPDYFLSHGSIYAAHVSFLMGKPHLSFEDTGNREQIMLYKPFTEAILVSDSFSQSFGKKTVVYPGYHELAYLHPNRFVPKRELIQNYDINLEQKLVLIRFVSWNATHDFNHQGISLELKREAVRTLSKYARVLISSESELPSELESFQVDIDPVHIHHLMAHCSLVFGESGTMASEAAVLGVPAIYIDSTSRDYTQEQEEKYGLVHNFSERSTDIRRAIETAVRIIKDDDAMKYEERRARLLADKVDVTSFLKDFILDYDRERRLSR